jgi:HTH-type transcriptional regulator, competence development regulator
MTETTLAATLQRAREMRGLSLKAAAEPARISATYLQKLERGQVGEPSPHVLYRLAEHLDLPYHDLMKLAGYVVPNRRGAKSAPQKGGPLTHALSSEPLTEEESRALAEYLAFLRQRRGAS